MNKRQVLSFIKRRFTKAERAQLVQRNEEQLLEVSETMNLLLIPDFEHVGLKVELLRGGSKKGAESNNIYFYSTSQLRITEFFNSDEEDFSC